MSKKIDDIVFLSGDKELSEAEREDIASSLEKSPEAAKALSALTTFQHELEQQIPPEASEQFVQATMARLPKHPKSSRVFESTMEFFRPLEWSLSAAAVLFVVTALSPLPSEDSSEVGFTEDLLLSNIEDQFLFETLQGEQELLLDSLLVDDSRGA